MTGSFAERWRRKEREHGLEEIASEMIQLGQDVLPARAAPCLTFEEASRPAPIWEVIARASYWSPEDRQRLAPYRMIGSDGAGNPICIEQGSGTVWLLDHEDWFHTLQFVNSSVRELAECLLAYVGEKDAARFRTAVREMDPSALAEGSFWWNEAACMDAYAAPTPEIQP